MSNQHLVRPERPVIDYANLPYMDREGVQTVGNNKFATRSLFFETAHPDDKPRAPWCMAEHELYVMDRWIPSACMVYINAKDEYDAAMKICGNIRQWERLKKMKVPRCFADYLAAWQIEQAMIQRRTLKESLLSAVRSGESGLASNARLVLQLIDGTTNKKGRPAKGDVPVGADPTGQVDDDHSRVASLFGARK